MKTKELFLCVLFLFAVQIFYGQDITNKTNFGKRYSKNIHAFKQKKSVLPECNTIYSFNGKDIPTGLAWDGENFWLVDTGSIYKVSPTGSYLDSLDNPATMISFLQGGELAYDGNHLWYADEQSAMLFKIDPSTKSVMQEFELPTRDSIDPNGFSIAWDGNYLWHCTYDPPMLYKLNPYDCSIISSVTMDKSVLTLEWAKGRLYGIGDSAFYKINEVTGIADDSITWCVPFPLGLAWDGTAFWNVSGPSEIFGFPTGGLDKVFKMNAAVILSMDDNVGKQEISISPNPASEAILIKGDRISQVEIYDVTGNLIYRKSGIKQASPFEVTVSTFPKGIYFTRVYDESGVNTRKLIVQ